MIKSQILLVLGLLVATSLASTQDEFQIRLRNIANQVNKAQTTWTATTSVKFTNLEATKKLMGVRKDENGPKLPTIDMQLTEEQIMNIPDEFDSREKWSNCPSISNIYDQSGCGSCWAVGAASVMTDRYCIGGSPTNISSIDLVACCTDCGMGCDGGYPASAFRQWVRKGIVTGGEYHTENGCKPYPFEPCEHHAQGPRKQCSEIKAETPQCERECRPGYSTSWASDLKFGTMAYHVRSESNIKYEIMTKGPVEADFQVFEDFLTYKSGVYQHVTGKSLGGHAIRMIGWGVEDGTPYWLCTNQWNTDWGNQGLFRILAGSNECGIEGDIVTGMPRI